MNRKVSIVCEIVRPLNKVTKLSFLRKNGASSTYDTWNIFAKKINEND